MSTSGNQQANEIFPKGDKAPADYFTGTAWIRSLVKADHLLNTVVANVIFEPGARNNWHTHTGGQILIITDGQGYYQERGKPVQLLKKADVVNIPPNIEHWHGASHNSSLTHLAINPNTDDGIVNWLSPVTDQEYDHLK